MSFETLRKECDDVTQILEAAIKSDELYSKESNPLGIGCCGFATALLQRHLERRGVATERFIGYPPQLPRVAGSRRANHVVLFTENGTIIDPTHGQFLGTIGLTRDLLRKTDTGNLLPKPEIALIPRANEYEFGREYAQCALSKRAIIHAANMDAFGGASTFFSPLVYSSDADVAARLSDTWNPEHYFEPFPIPNRQLSMPSFQVADKIMQDSVK